MLPPPSKIVCAVVLPLIVVLLHVLTYLFQTMNSGSDDPMSCNYCVDRTGTPDTTSRLTRNGFSDFSLTGYGAINNSFDDYEYNKNSPDSEYHHNYGLEESVGTTQRTLMSIESKILRPYSAILKFLGMRELRGEYCIHKLMSVLWPILLFCCLISGYVINYEICQNDEHPSYETAEHDKMKNICANASLSYIYMDSLCESTLDSVLPSAIHFIAFAFTFWIFRIKRSEQVEALVQKCFVTSFSGTNTDVHKKQLNRRLKVYSLYGLISLIGLLIMTLINSYFGKTLVLSRCMESYPLTSTQKYFTGIGYAIPMFLMHVTYFPILVNYIMQSRLIGFLINELRETLREKRTTLKVLMQESHDTSSFVHKMNHESSPAVSLMLFYLFYGFFIDMRVIIAKSRKAGSLSNLWDYGAQCNLDVYSAEECQIVNEVMNFGRVSLISMIVKHFILGLLVFLLVVEGCKVSMSFHRLINQAMETRVFGFKSACFHELDSFHYYLKSLRMRAKLFQFPLETKRLLFPFIVLIYIGLCILMTWSE